MKFILNNGYVPGKQQIDPLLFIEVNCIDILTEFFVAGKSYSVLISARSALSTFLTLYYLTRQICDAVPKFGF